MVSKLFLFCFYLKFSLITHFLYLAHITNFLESSLLTYSNPSCYLLLKCKFFRFVISKSGLSYLLAVQTAIFINWSIKGLNQILEMLSILNLLLSKYYQVNALIKQRYTTLLKTNQNHRLNVKIKWSLIIDHHHVQLIHSNWILFTTTK